MESPRGVDEPFPEADAEGELYPSTTKNFTVDSVSSEVARSKQLKEQARNKEAKKEQEKKDAAHRLKSSIIISGVVVAVIGAIFALTKKLRERRD